MTKRIIYFHADTNANPVGNGRFPEFHESAEILFRIFPPFGLISM